MAKYISYKVDNGFKQIFKIHSSDASKTFWNDRENSLTFVTITDDEFIKFKKLNKYTINADDSLSFEAPVETVEINKDFVEDKLKNHIEEIKEHIVNHQTPLFSQSNIDYLQGINLDSITWPVNVNSPEGWVEALEINSITLDHIFEV